MDNNICLIPNCNTYISDDSCYRALCCFNYKTCFYCINGKGIQKKLCDHHKYTTIFICPCTQKPHRKVHPWNIVVPSNFRKGSVVSYSWNNPDGNGRFIKFDDGAYVCLNNYNYTIFKPVGHIEFHLYTDKIVFNLKEFLEQEQYTYRPILDSLYINSIMYIHSLPKDITGIIRTYL